MEQDPSLEAQRALLERRANTGSSWFFWIAAFSLINSVLHFAGSGVGFMAGLGITIVIDLIVQKLGTLARIVGLVLDIGIAGFFVGMWLLAKRHSAGFVVGMVVYVIDTLLFLLVRDWMGLAFHAFALYSIVIGLRATLALAKLPTPEAPAVAGPE